MYARRCLAFVAVGLLLTACSGTAASRTPPPAETSTDGTLAGRGTSSAYLISTLDDKWGNYDPRGLHLKAIDPLTGQDMAGSPPVHLGHDGGWAASPDGTKIAFTYEPGDGNGLHGLSLFDLAHWKPLPIPELKAQALTAFWKPDNRTLLVVTNDPDCSPSVSVCESYHSELVTIDIDQSNIVRRSNLPFSSTAFVSDDGDTLYLFGNEWHYDRVLPTRLIAIDVPSGAVLRDMTLDDVLFGHQPVTDAAGISCSATYVAGGALSPDGSRFYVFLPGTDEVLIVDPVHMKKLEMHTISRPQSRLGHILGWFAVDAEAKGGAVLSGGALLSPDGSFFVRTWTSAPTLSCDDSSPTVSEPISMQVIDAKTMEIIRDVPLPDDLGYGYRQMRFSRDGKRLYAFLLLDLVVIDVDSMQIVARRPAYPAGDVVTTN